MFSCIHLFLNQTDCLMPFGVPFLFGGLHCSWSVENILKCANSNIGRHVMKISLACLNHNKSSCSNLFTSFTVIVLCNNNIVLPEKALVTSVRIPSSGTTILVSVALKFISPRSLFSKVIFINYTQFLIKIFFFSPRNISLI